MKTEEVSVAKITFLGKLNQEILKSDIHWHDALDLEQFIIVIKILCLGRYNLYYECFQLKLFDYFFYKCYSKYIEKETCTRRKQRWCVGVKVNMLWQNNRRPLVNLQQHPDRAFFFFYQIDFIV